MSAEPTDYDRPAVEIACQQLTRMLEAFSEATGFPVTFASEALAGDRAFYSRIRNGANLNFATYDRVFATASALWPEGAEWPEGLPHLPPIEVDADILAAIEVRRAKAAAAKDGGGERPSIRNRPLPGNAPWPDDIPRPANTTADPTHPEASNG